jgi:hypothetical protein
MATMWSFCEDRVLKFLFVGGKGVFPNFATTKSFFARHVPGQLLLYIVHKQTATSLSHTMS